MIKYRSRLMGIAIAAAVAACPVFTQAQATVPTSQATESEAVGPLRIQVTAVQGGTQYRLNPDSKWQTLSAGIELPEGVEFRTGPKGTIQFTVGTDQVYRVDRLTAAKILRAALLPDGTIKTDLGMTYGRVSKDVDLATHPHEDRIISPSSTLAVRGTRVALYDQPPYTPEAISLTGAAVFQNLHGQLVQLGSKGSGPATVNGDSTSAAETQLQNTAVDPQGAFSGRTQQEQTQVVTLTGLQNTQLGFVTQIQAQFGGESVIQQHISLPGVTSASGDLQFPIFWTSSTPSTMVDLFVVSPKGDFVDPFKQTSANGGFYVQNGSDSNIAKGSTGQEEVDFGVGLTTSGGVSSGGSTAPLGTFVSGNYTVFAVLTGSTTQTLAQNPAIQATVHFFADEVVANSNQMQTRSEISAQSQVTTLGATSPVVVYSVKTPITANEPIPQATTASQLQSIEQTLSGEISGASGSEPTVRRRR